jgi:hypothetical protein
MSFTAEPEHDSFWNYDWIGPFDYRPPGQPATMLTATALRLVYVGSTGRIDNLERLVVTGSNLDSLTITDEAINKLGQWHRFLGGAVLDTTDTNSAPTLRVSHLGSTGEDGIETIVNGITFVGEVPQGSLRQRVVQFCEWWPGTLLNGHVRWTATGRISNSIFRGLGDLTLFQPEQGAMALSARFDGIGATQAVVEVFNGPALVGSFTTPVGLVGSVSSIAQLSRVNAEVVDLGLAWGLKWDTRSSFYSPNGVRR